MASDMFSKSARWHALFTGHCTSWPPHAPAQHRAHCTANANAQQERFATLPACTLSTKFRLEV
eukprot:690618-Rhodomonas_salina.3